MITAEKTEFSVTPANSSTVVDRPRARNRASPYTTLTAPSDPAKLASGTAGMPASESGTPRMITSIAPNEAPADTPSVKRGGQRIAEQGLQHDPRGGQRGTHQRARQRPRQPGDEEDLRIDVVGERDGGVETPHAG